MECAEISTSQESEALRTLETGSETNGEPMVILLDDDDAPEKPAEVTVVIDLDEYQRDGGKRKRGVNNRCINFECENGEEMRCATAFCLNYYRVKIRPKRLQEVCAACYEESLRYYENLVATLRAGDCLIEQGGPVRDDFVELDSDEETPPAPTEIDAPLAPETQTFLEDALPQALNDVLETYDVQGQSERACNYLTSQQKLLDVALDELSTVQRDIQRQVDALRNDLYATFQQRIKELPPIEIGHTFQAPPTSTPAAASPKPLAPKPLTPMKLAPRPPLVLPQQTVVPPPPPPIRRDPERRSNRNIHKPASYCEDDNVDSPPSAEALGKQQPPPPPLPPNATTAIVPIPKVAVVTASAPTASAADSALLLPPKGLVPRPRPSVDQVYYALRQTLFGAWGKVRVVEITGNVEAGPGAALYRVRFDTKMKGSAGIKMVNGKELAYCTPSPVQLEVGTRVIAVFSDEANLRKDNYFAGVIAETLGTYNNYR